MKKVLFAAVIMFSLVFASASYADPIVTASWQVDSLKDDSGADITGLVLDIEMGGQFYQINGIAFVDPTFAVVYGAAYDDPVGAIMYINVGQHLLTVFTDSNLNGEISIYGPDNKLIDTGTVSFMGVE